MDLNGFIFEKINKNWNVEEEKKILLKPIHWVKSSAQWYVFQRMNSWCQLWQVGKVWWEWYVFQRMKIVQNCLLNEWILENFSVFLILWWLKQPFIKSKKCFMMGFFNKEFIFLAWSRLQICQSYFLQFFDLTNSFNNFKSSMKLAKPSC